MKRSVLVALVLLIPTAVFAASGIARTYLMLGQCYLNCSANQHCIVKLVVTGPAAMTLLRALTPLGPEREEREAGVDIYLSRDNLLECDAIDGAPSCQVTLDLDSKTLDRWQFCE